MRNSLRWGLIVVLLSLTGCASQPRFAAPRADLELFPATVAAAPASHLGKQVLWGGIIVATRNQADHTELEILSYPLDEGQRPDILHREQGRFIARLPRYLEAINYAPGRQVTISGKVGTVLAGKVGEAPYTFPLLEGEDIQLWPRSGSEPPSPRFHFGIGVIFSR